MRCCTSAAAAAATVDGGGGLGGSGGHETGDTMVWRCTQRHAPDLSADDSPSPSSLLLLPPGPHCRACRAVPCWCCCCCCCPCRAVRQPPGSLRCLSSRLARCSRKAFQSQRQVSSQQRQSCSLSHSPAFSSHPPHPPG